MFENMPFYGCKEKNEFIVVINSSYENYIILDLYSGKNKNCKLEVCTAILEGQYLVYEE